MEENKPSWKKHMTAVRIKRGKGRENKTSKPMRSNYSSYLPTVYTGLTNRVDRYMQYDQMDQDSEISTGMDILAEFCTQNSDDFEAPLMIHYKDNKMGDVEVTTLEDRLQAWVDLNDFCTKGFDIFRNVLKYGDQFFIRDPETYEWLWVNPASVEKVTVNESEGKKPELYFIKDLQLNLQDKVVAKNTMQNSNIAYPGALPNSLSQAGNNYGGSSGGTNFQSSSSSPFPSSAQQGSHAVLAEHVVHISRSTQMDAYWPFGTSILEDIFKTYKQKELLEDSIIIYRVQRAPERRVFKIDTGDLPDHLAMQHVERIKNEIHQRRIPTARGGSSSLMDAAYNPMCFDMSTRVPLLDGRTLSIAELALEYQAGKENWAYSCHPETGEIVPGNITWAGVTRKNAKVIKVALDNGETFVCTPDHKVVVIGVGFKEAKDLTEDDVLAGFSTKTVNGYEYCNNKKTSEVVGSYFKEINKHQEYTFLEENLGKEKTVIDYKDGSISNNDPRNIRYMNADDAVQYIDKKDYLVQTRNDIKYGSMVQSIEYLTDTQDVGTITIDGDERWHNFHTFAIESGIFVKNSILEDFFFPQSADGRGSDVTTLPGGDNLGQIDDLKWFNNKLIRGLKIPQSYLPFGPEDTGQVFNDGKIGTALIQEFRFNKYCQRLQATLSKKFDQEFKKYLEDSGYQFNYKTFEVKFRPPLNFATYRKAELESTLINCYTGLNELSFVAKQTLLKKMGWTQDEIIENEKLWLQENPDLAAPVKGSALRSDKPDLSSVGIDNPSESPAEPMNSDPDMSDSPVPDSPDAGSGSDTAGSTF